MFFSSAQTTGRKMMKHIALLLVGAAALANAVPVARENTCATICDIAQTKFNFEPGKTYAYDYEGETLTRIEGASEEVSGLHVKTTARIHVITPCEFQLELRGTELSHLAPNNPAEKNASPVGGAFKDALEANAVRFGMNNGKVEGVCGGTKDASWVLNIKRAIISALQNNMADLKTGMTIRETDVVGTCDTVYKPMPDGSIVKTKNLLGCINREYMNSMIQHSHYNVPSDIQGVPFLKSEHTCKQVVAGGKITEVTCTESHIARAFSNGEAGAATTLKMKMTFKGAVAETMAPRPVAFTAPITFDMTKTEREIKDAVGFVRTAITEICAADHVEGKSAERFSKLIKNVQALDATTLTRLHQELEPNACKIGKKTFHDVLPLAGTPAAVSVMKDILLAGEIDGVEADMWKSALAFIPNPNEEIIAHVTPLLAKPDRKTYLSTSTLVRNFCAQQKDCAGVKQVQDFIKVLEAHVGTDGSGDEEVVLMSLKAIGNAGVTMTGKPALIKCIKNEKISMDLRIAALEAFRHMELGSVKLPLLEIYKNMDLDPEIRIGAFVALMRDPCKMCIDTVQATMAKERVLQVGSFVMSFMENARKSVNPAKKEVNTILRMFDETKIKRDWNLERMKYSRAYEASHFSSYLNAGVDAESHVIFSPAGFLPRQIKTDLNVNLFGRSINLFEIGARMEGLENVLEYYFGPNGPLTETGVGRTKRAALDKDGIDKIHEKVKTQNIKKDARGLMYLKMFGSELGYQNFDLESILAKKDKINVLELLKTIAKNHEHEYTHNFQLMDMTYTIPTVLGLPLKLDLNAHGTMHLKVGGKLDIVKLMQPPRNMDIDGYIKPSAAIEVKTEMGIDAFLTQTGIKMVANIHTATAIEGKILLEGGKKFQVHYAVPKTEQEVFHGETKFFVKHHEDEREQRMITKDAISIEKCTGDTLGKITGLEMCGEVRLPSASMVKTAPYFPLTGGVNVKLAIKKRDAKLTSYDFEASRTSDKGVETLKLILDTPGSEINRELATIVTLDTVQKSLSLDVRSPWKKVHAEAAFVNQPDLKKVTTKLIVDDEKEYSAIATVALQQENDIMKIIPGFNVIMNGKNPLKAGGLITIQKNAKVVADLKIENLTEKPITLVGSLEQVHSASSLRLNHDITFTSPLITLAGKGHIEKQRVKLTIRSENSFKFRDGKEHKMTFDTKLHSERRRDVHIFNVQSNLELSDFPEHNVHLVIDFKRTATITNFDVEATFRKDMNPVKFTKTLTHQLTAPMKIGMKSVLVLPTVTLSMEHKLNQIKQKEYEFLSVATWAEGKEARAEFTIILDDSEKINAEIKGFIMAPIIPRVDLDIRVGVSKAGMELVTEMKYGKHNHGFVLTANKESPNTFNVHSHVLLDGDRHEMNIKARIMTNLIDIKADAKLKGKSFGINFNAAMEKTALKVHTAIIAPETTVELNVNGEMTGEAIKAHIDAALNGKKVEANLGYFRKGLTLKVSASINGLIHLKSKIGSLTLKVENQLNGQELMAEVEATADNKQLVHLNLNGSLTSDEISANVKLTAATMTVAGEILLTRKDGEYSATLSATVPKRTVRFVAKYAQNEASILIDLNKEDPGNTFEYNLKWGTAATPDRTQYKGELNMKVPTYLFPLPIKVTALLDKDVQGTYKAEITIDYSLKFELKAIHKITPYGIETNVEINTPMEHTEKMTAELVATLIENKLNFKLAASHKAPYSEPQVVEIILTGMATEAQQALDFAFKTPFKGLEMITATIKNKIAGLNIDASAELKWGINKKVAIVFGNKADGMANILGRLTIVTPIIKYETTTLEYGFTTKADTRNMLVKLTLADKVAEWTIVHTLKPDVKMGMGFVTESSIKIPSVEDIKMTIDFEYKPMRLLSLDVKGMLGLKTVSLVTKAENTETKIDASLILITPKNPEGTSVSFLFNNPSAGKLLDATLTLNIDPKRTIKLTAYMKKEDWTQTEGKIEFTSFFSQKVAIDFGWHVNEPEKTMKANLVLEYVPGKKITTELEIVGKKPNMMFSFMVTTPIDPLRKIRYHIKSTGGMDNLISHAEAQINEMTVSSDLVIKFLSWADFDTSLTVLTPIRNYEKTILAVSNKATGNKMTATISMLLKGKTWSIEGIQQALTADSLEYFLTVTTPVANLEKIALSVSNKGTPKDMLTNAALTLNTQTWMVALKTRFADLTDMFFGITVTTPLKRLETITVELSHKGTLANMVSSITVDVPNQSQKPAVIELSAKILKLTDMEVKLSLKDYDLIVAPALPITITISNRGETLKPLVTIVSLTAGSKAYTLTSTLNFEGISNMDGSLVLTTPIENYEHVGLTWANKIADGRKEAKLIVEFQTNQLITIEGHIQQTGMKIESRFTLTTPFAAFDKAFFSLDFTGVLTNFEGAVIVELPKIRKTEIHFSNKLDLTNGISHKGSFRIDCIFFSNTAIDTTLTFKDNTLTFETKFGYGFRRGTYTLTAKWTTADAITLELATALTSDWTDAKSAAVSFTFALKNTHLTLKTMLKLNEVDLLSVSFEHLPGFKCILALKQKIIKTIPETWEANLDVKIALSESQIKLTSTADGSPLISLEFKHTYGPEALTAKLVGSFKNLNAEGDVLINVPKDTFLIQVSATKNGEKIVEFMVDSRPTADKSHGVQVKVVYEGKTLVNVVLKVSTDLSNAAIEIQESGKNILGLTGKLIGHDLEVHLAWWGAPLIDLKSEFKPTPLSIAIELKYKGELILNTGTDLELRENSFEAHIKWNGAPLIDVKTNFRATPYTFAVELKYKGKLLVLTDNVLDLKAKTLKALLNIDPLLQMVMENPESWIVSVEGQLTQRRDLVTLSLDLKKVDKVIHLEVGVKRNGKIDLTLRPASLTVELKTSTMNFAQNMDAVIVMDIKKNDELFKTTLVALINKVENLRTVIELKRSKTVVTMATELFILPLNINSAANIKLDIADAISYEIVGIANKSNAKATTATITGTVGMRPDALLFEIKAMLPSRTMVLSIKHVRTNGNIEHMVSLSWEAGKTTGYSFTLSDRSRSGSGIYNLVGEFTHPIRTVKYTAKAEISSQKYFLSLDILPDASLPERKTFFAVDIVNQSQAAMLNLKGDVTFGHPSLDKPLTLNVGLTLNRGKMLMASTMNFSYSKTARKDITASFRIVKESAYHYALVSELKQPINFVDVRVNAEIRRTGEGAISQTTSFSYFTSKREIKTITTAILLNIPGKNVEIRFTSPTADAKVIIALVNDVAVEGRHMRLTLTHEDILANAVTRLMDVELDETNRAFRTEVGDILKINAGIHDKYMVHLSIMAKERKILLFKTNFKDATHMLINTKLEWDPVLLETIKTEIPPIVAKVSGAVVNTLEPIAKEILADLEAKIAAFKEFGWKDLKPIFDAWKRFVRALDKDLSTALKGLKQMWRENEFYLKDATNLIVASWEEIKMHSKTILEHLERYYKEMMVHLRSLETTVKAHMEWVNEEFAKVRVQIEATLEEIKPVVETFVRENLEWIIKEVKELLDQVEPKVKAAVARIMKTIGHMRKNVLIPLVTKVNEGMAALRVALDTKFAPLIAKLEAMWTEFLAKMEEIKASGLAKTLTELQATLEAKYATTSAAIVAWINEITAKFETAIKEWEIYPQVVELKKSIEDFGSKLVWAWNYIDIPGELTNWMQDLRMKVEEFWRIIKANKSTLLTWDTAKGILEFDVEIPIALKELAHLPKIDDLISRLDIARRELIANMPKINWTFMDYYYYWMPKSTNLVDLVPPFTATGVVAGNQHFFTFDGSFIEFAGDCSYVLARDFADGKFTVIANYRRTRAGPKRNSLTVMAGDKTIEIFNSFRTVVDKDVTELPIETEEAMVKRAGVDQITIQSKKGMTVSCHMKTEICTVAISGWYFGKTGGLLGTYDYEPSTDTTNPMGKRLEDVERFANTWEVAKSCSDKTNYAKAFHKVANIETTAAYRVCASLFLDDSSALRPAFRILDTTPFMNMCVNEVFEWQNHPESEMMMTKKACTAAAAYMAEAEIKGIMLEAPAGCMSCEKSTGGEMAVGETEKVTSPINGVDTVVVVEENICNKNRRKDLLGLISSVQRAYKAQGLKDNLFGLAAFGGDGVHDPPHFHTIEGQIMNQDRKFVRGVRSLEFKEDSPLADVEAGIAFAAKNYPWRAGVKRNIIVLTCSQCQNSVTDLEAVLTEFKVNVHMLRDVELAFRGGKRASNVLGFDPSGVFTTKDTSSRTLTGDEALLAQLAVPKESCIAPLMTNNGSFFTINALTNGRVRDQKKLIDVVSRRVAAAATPESCQICECKVICPYTMKTSNICKPCRK